MADGEGHWAAITELRHGHTRHERELGALGSKVSDLTDDVNNLATEQRKTRHELRTQITAAEGRLMKELRRERDASLTAWRYRLTLAIPIFCVALTFALAKAIG